MTRKLSQIAGIALAVGAAAAVAEARTPSAASALTVRAPFQSRCLANVHVERIMRARFEVATEIPRPRDFLLDTLSISGSTFTLVTSDSVCALARIVYINTYHGHDSTRKAHALAGLPAVMVVALKPNRFWIASMEMDDYQLYRRLLVDSLWNVVSKQL